ncbi:putative HTH-type transcriptional regulator YbaQ [compost metagenome]
MMRMPPIHPGEVLREELLRPYRLSLPQLARAIGVSPSRLRGLTAGRTPVTAELALRLGRYFGLSPAFWLNLQQHYDLSMAADAMQERIDREVIPFVSGLPGW